MPTFEVIYTSKDSPGYESSFRTRDEAEARQHAGRLRLKGYEARVVSRDAGVEPILDSLGNLIGTIEFA